MLEKTQNAQKCFLSFTPRNPRYSTILFFRLLGEIHDVHCILLLLTAHAHTQVSIGNKCENIVDTVDNSLGVFYEFWG